MTILLYICNCKTEFVSNRLKAYKLQTVVQAPTSVTASSNYYLGPLGQRTSIWRLGEYIASTIGDHALQKQEVVMEWKQHPFPLAT